MAKALELTDYDEMFHSLDFNPILLNDLKLDTAEDRKWLNSLLITSYNDDDSLSTIPSCLCGATSIGHAVGERCGECGQLVASPTDTAIVPNVWFRAPEGIQSLISPHLWLTVGQVMRKGRFNVLRWFCNPYAPDPLAKNKVAWSHIRKLTNSGIPRGLNSFVQNFNQLIPIIVSMVPHKPARAEMELYLNMFQNRFFPRHLFVPNRIAVIMENTPTGTYVDNSFIAAVDAAKTICANVGTDVSVKRLESKFTIAIDTLSQYYHDLLGKPFTEKEGWLRHVMLGARMPFSYRTVITSRSEVHEYDTIKIPYTEFVNMFKIHLMGILRNRGYSKRKSWDFISAYTVRRCDEMYSAMHELLDQSGEGIWSLLIRYPTLNRASVQAFRIVGWSDATTEISVLSIVGSNADFDGDQLSGHIACSKVQAEYFKWYQPHYAIFAYNDPGKLTGQIKLPDNTVGAIAAWFEDEENQIMEKEGVEYGELWKR